ncbi:MepB family protein [Flavobacterium frigoris]|uniref:MepB protein n=1 Tax=Flavobacterium frigoris TaxID=229204 RepID=A0A1H9NBV4_FLAFI|nr:MepB family protein [Flavobacterium frigoris]SER33301.1 hypothetical protein SAMN05444355_11062 [Flavobacterium frigoris]
MKTATTIYNDLFITKELIYDPCGFNFSSLEKEVESIEYGAATFELNGVSVTFRNAKITPTKTGQFVTLWKRIEKGPIQPFAYTDPIDFVIINTRKGQRLGQFIFPKLVLCERGVITTSKKEGKRAIRVYPPWNQANNAQAQKTQKWQLDYFLEIPSDKPININRVKLLYGL